MRFLILSMAVICGLTSKEATHIHPKPEPLNQFILTAGDVNASIARADKALKSCTDNRTHYNVIDTMFQRFANENKLDDAIQVAQWIIDCAVCLDCNVAMAGRVLLKNFLLPGKFTISAKADAAIAIFKNISGFTDAWERFKESTEAADYILWFNLHEKYVDATIEPSSWTILRQLRDELNAEAIIPKNDLRN